MKSLKKVLSLMLVLIMAAAVILTGCGNSTQGTDVKQEPKKDEKKLEQKLVIYSPHGKEILEYYAQKFEKDKGVKVEWLFLGAQECYDRIKSEKDNPQADVFFGGPSSMFMKAKSEGLLQPYKPSWDSKVDAIFKDSESYWYGNWQTPVVLFYNNMLLKPEEAPKDWGDLLDSKWKDKVLVRYPLASGSMRALFTSLIYDKYKTTKDTKDAFEFLKKLDANTKEYSNSSAVVFQAIAKGEGTVSMWALPDVQTQIAKNMPFTVVMPASGSPVITDAMGIVKGAKNINAAKEFIEYISNEEESIYEAKTFNRIPSRTDVLSKCPEWMSQKIKAMDVDWKLLSEKETEWLKYWDENIKAAAKVQK